MPYPLHIVAFLTTAATLPLLFLSHLPELNKLIWLLAVSLLLVALPVKFFRYLGITGMLVVWAMLAAQQSLAPLSKLTTGTVTVITEITQVLQDKGRLIIRLRSYNNQLLFPPLYASVLTGQQNVTWCAGQRWKMRIRLRPVHGNLNEGGFDAQRFALANSVPLRGVVVAAEPLENHCSWRHYIMARAQKQYQRLPWHSVMTALLFGDRQELTAETRAVLRDTGIAHLMAISGMHISLAASLGWSAARLLQFLMPAWRIRYTLSATAIV